jgi:hypothetical protein
MPDDATDAIGREVDGAATVDQDIGREAAIRFEPQVRLDEQASAPSGRAQRHGRLATVVGGIPHMGQDRGARQRPPSRGTAGMVHVPTCDNDELEVGVIESQPGQRFGDLAFAARQACVDQDAAIRGADDMGVDETHR